MSYIINKPHLTTKIPIWSPRYKDKYGDLDEPVVLIAKYKVHHATSVMIIEFTKAKHLIGQRFAISRDKAQRYPIDSNGKIPCYAVPLSALEPYDTAQEILEIANEVFD